MTEQVETPTASAPGGHPVAELATQLRTRLDALTDPATTRPVWAMDAAEQRQVLTDLAVAAAQLEALRLQVLAEADLVALAEAYEGRLLEAQEAVAARKSVENGRLLCGHHHRRIHDPAYDFHRRE